MTMYTHLDDHISISLLTPGFKPFKHLEQQSPHTTSDHYLHMGSNNSSHDNILQLTQGPAMVAAWLVCTSMHMTKESQMKHATITKPRTWNVLPSTSVVLARLLVIALLSKTTLNGNSVNMVRIATPLQTNNDCIVIPLVFSKGLTQQIFLEIITFLYKSSFQCMLFVILKFCPFYPYQEMSRVVIR